MNIHNTIRRLLVKHEYHGDICSSLISAELNSPGPSMIGRFGSTEVKAILFPKLPSLLKTIFRNRIYSNMETLSGFFPSNNESIRRFSQLMYDDMRELDILGSWRIEEELLKSNFPSAKRIELRMLEPYFSENPWTACLEGKKVLVVHPFSKTIESQYQINRTKLFPNERVLPQFSSLSTVRAIQSIAGTSSQYSNWFDALESMKTAIDLIDYEIAILGCGAYGFPLAAHIKRSGKKAIHLGGATQVLFGIRGKRWDTHPIVSKFYNDFWVRPSNDDTPPAANKVENGCYW